MLASKAGEEVRVSVAFLDKTRFEHPGLLYRKVWPVASPCQGRAEQCYHESIILMDLKDPPEPPGRTIGAGLQEYIRPGSME